MMTHAAGSSPSAARLLQIGTGTSGCQREAKIVLPVARARMRLLRAPPLLARYSPRCPSPRRERRSSCSRWVEEVIHPAGQGQRGRRELLLIVCVPGNAISQCT